MHTVELLEEALALAMQCGFTVRQEWLGGLSAGGCQFNGRQWIFVDLALSPQEQLDQVLDGLRGAETSQAIMSVQLDSLLKMRKAA